MKTLSVKSIKRKLHVVAIFSGSLLMFAPLFSYAVTTTERVILRCCTDAACPTRYVSAGEPGVTQTVTFIKEVVPLGGEELEIPVFGDPGYDTWKISVREGYDKATAAKLFRASRVHVFAQCSSKGLKVISGDEGRTLACPEGAGINISDYLKCPNPEQGPYSVVEITKTKEDVEDIDQFIRESRQRFEARQREHERIREEIRLEDETFDRLNQRVRESGFFEALSFGGSGPKF